MLSFKEIKELIDLVSERGLSGLEVEQAGFRVRIEGMRPPSSNGSAAAPALAAPPSEDKSIHVITSPIVG
ncbi:MAG TPA: acetyl-CoA carboxylase, biotin carboxyl carrier protein, partial [Thermoanaerobaculia bacterium]|nr:acetyl-CoA carboxylase, biotin carboxyl carrier protein [Thermoanaerobaculia bacterium]